MTDQARIPHRALILVADGARALILRNTGPALSPKLELVRTLEAPPNPADHRHDPAERPGRLPAMERRSAVQTTDRHDLAERRFEAETALAFTEAVAAEPDAPLALVSAPRSLATLRETLPEAVRARVAAEIAKDLVNHPLPEIARVLTPD